MVRAEAGDGGGNSRGGAPTGGLILVPLSSYLIELAGWRTTWAVLGVMVLALAVPLAYLVMREQPQDLGLMPDGDARQTSADGKVIRVVKRAPLESERWVSCFGTLPMWQLSGAYFVCGFTTALISAHFVPFAIEAGYSQSMAASAFGVMSGLNVVGVMMAGALGDRFGRKNLLALVYLLRGGAYVMLLLVPGLLGLWSFSLVAGFSWIATVPLTTSLTADVYGLRNIGILGGIVFMAHQIGGAISIQLAGRTARCDGLLRGAVDNCRGAACVRQPGELFHSGEEVFGPLPANDHAGGAGTSRGLTWRSGLT